MFGACKILQKTCCRQSWLAGLDTSPYQSGMVDIKSRSISKRGSSHLRKMLFQIVDVILKTSPVD
ncbi:MAG: IS110 family transposase [Lachnospiraceae bacterium]|nr:IS110 family transposase [Lachnospiraceae bacterium]